MTVMKVTGVRAALLHDGKGVLKRVHDWIIVQ